MTTPLRGALNDVERLFGRRDALVGMIHLHPLPGSPRYDPAQGMPFTLKVALEESELLARAGFDGLIVENAWDIPFLPPELGRGRDRGGHGGGGQGDQGRGGHPGGR